MDIGSKAAEFFSALYSNKAMRVMLALYVVGFIAECLLPAQKQRARDRWFNLKYSALGILFFGYLAPLQIFVSDAAIGALGMKNIFDLRFDTLRSLPLSVAAVGISMFITDFFYYWFHRWQHQNRFLWQEHLLHHSDVAFNVTTANRTHFLEQLFHPLFVALPLTVLFNFPTSSVAVLSWFPTVWGYVNHMNIRVSFGPLWWLFVSPQFHRMHHSVKREHHDKNYAVFFPIWDILFRTAHRPAPAEYPETGVDGVVVDGIGHALILPFVGWRRMLADAIKTARAPKQVHPGSMR